MDPSESPHGTPFRPRNGSAGGSPISVLAGNTVGGPQRSGTGSAMLRASPYSPFPFGLPIQSSNRSLLSPGSLDQQEVMENELERKDRFSSDNVYNHSGLHVLRGRVRAQDVYGGKFRNYSYHILLPIVLKKSVGLFKLVYNLMTFH